ncbi:MAG: hypothetical protein V1793_04960 [Pseudomonadota bacterium]
MQESGSRDPWDRLWCALNSLVIPAMVSRGVSVGTIAGMTGLNDGYVTITSQSGVAAFALYTNLKTGGYGYAGINGVDVSN